MAEARISLKFVLLAAAMSPFFHVQDAGRGGPYGDFVVALEKLEFEVCVIFCKITKTQYTRRFAAWRIYARDSGCWVYLV